ncbi:hypothetical protein [Pseudorhodoplanes sinuspersici]|uniref:Uncharacterized protein n=1 Tax=Pseudorhodoplanes sinuspersici TaxID=1235591 RepID=A0A1W7A015_9HYPH|nr:hypothetical protein [Pseudorhodoplanes sinuspersici]ARQ02355.1 hypothetical protein CAK95_27045 [Pseudorhodoplanes sinuspersici]RKE74182.1 hypothetical protein DFP91_2085 [Pseudorhodoplanes sinuspersici]
MGDDEALNYMNARRDYERLRNSWLRYVRAVSGVAEGLRAPERFFILADQSEPDNVGTNWDWSAWPSADDLRQSMIALKKARDAARRQWETLPFARQAELPKPPSRLGDP